MDGPRRKIPKLKWLCADYVWLNIEHIPPKYLVNLTSDTSNLLSTTRAYYSGIEDDDSLCREFCEYYVERYGCDRWGGMQRKHEVSEKEWWE